jgi:hypothetical protein
MKFEWKMAVDAGSTLSVITLRYREQNQEDYEEMMLSLQSTYCFEWDLNGRWL